MCELSMFAKKNCYFKHSAVWVSPFQLVFLRFPHPLNFHMQLKKKIPSNPPNVLGSRVRALWLLQRGHGKHKLTVELVPHSVAVRQQDQTAARCPSSSPVLLLTATDPRLSSHWRQAHGWLPSDGSAQRPCPPLLGAWDGCRCLLIPTHGPEDIRSSELIYC